MRESQPIGSLNYMPFMKVWFAFAASTGIRHMVCTISKMKKAILGQYLLKVSNHTSGITVGIANIAEEDEFFLSPYFGYRGKITLRADQIPMFYLGSIKLQNDCKNLQSMWYDIASYIDPADIVIELPENVPTSLADNTFNGIYISQDSLGGHSNFLSKYADRKDIEVISANGVLFYDHEEQGYVITTVEKLQDYTTPDPYLIFHNYDCDLFGTGRLNFLSKTGLVENQLAGSARHDLNEDEVN